MRRLHFALTKKLHMLTYLTFLDLSKACILLSLPPSIQASLNYLQCTFEQIAGGSNAAKAKETL